MQTFSMASYALNIHLNVGNHEDGKTYCDGKFDVVMCGAGIPILMAAKELMRHHILLLSLCSALSYHCHFGKQSRHKSNGML